MASDFQSSFIPKGPMTTPEVFKKKKAGMFGVLIFSLFVFSIILSVGLGVYKGIMKNSISDLENQLVEAEKNIDTKTINEMTQFSRKLELSKVLITKHKVVSNFLEVLASTTVSAVRFTDFNYGDLEPDKLSVKIRGEASNYASVALQENIFAQDKHFKSMIFSNLSLTENGKVSFDLLIAVDPQIAVYSP